MYSKYCNVLLPKKINKLQKKIPFCRQSSWPASTLHLRIQSFPCDSKQESLVNQTSADTPGFWWSCGGRKYCMLKWLGTLFYGLLYFFAVEVSKFRKGDCFFFKIRSSFVRVTRLRSYRDAPTCRNSPVFFILFLA